LLALLCDGAPERLVRLLPPPSIAPTPPPAAKVEDSAAPTSTLGGTSIQSLLTLNPTRDILAPAAVRLAQGQPIDNLGPPTTELYALTNRQLRLQDNRITGHVVHVDHYGNLITNISRSAVE